MPVAIPPDDLSISDEEMLYVRVYPTPDALVPVEGTDQHRAGSGALRRPGDPLSADLGSLCTPKVTQQRAGIDRAYHVAAFSAGAVRRAGCRVTRDPVEGNAAHALVWGDHQAGDGALSMKQTKLIAKESRIVLVV